MVELISRVRAMIGDTDVSAYTFDDDAIQAALDENRFSAEYVVLQPVAEYQPGGQAVYTQYRAPTGWWETDAALVDGNYNPLTPDSSDWMNGEWVFNAGQAPPVFIKGRYYDLNAAAADLLEEWAARLAREHDFSLGGDRFARSQMAENLREQAARYRGMAMVRVVFLQRGDA